jgi:hypothetical protein
MLAGHFRLGDIRGRGGVICTTSRIVPGRDDITATWSASAAVQRHRVVTKTTVMR